MGASFQIRCGPAGVNRVGIRAIGDDFALRCLNAGAGGDNAVCIGDACQL